MHSGGGAWRADHLWRHRFALWSQRALWRWRPGSRHYSSPVQVEVYLEGNLHRLHYRPALHTRPGRRLWRKARFGIRLKGPAPGAPLHLEAFLNFMEEFWKAALWPGGRWRSRDRRGGKSATSGGNTKSANGACGVKRPKLASIIDGAAKSASAYRSVKHSLIRASAAFRQHRGGVLKRKTRRANDAARTQREAKQWANSGDDVKIPSSDKTSWRYQHGDGQAISSGEAWQ